MVSLSSVQQNIINAFVSLILSFLVVCLLSSIIKKVVDKFSRNFAGVTGLGKRNNLLTYTQIKEFLFADAQSTLSCLHYVA